MFDDIAPLDTARCGAASRGDAGTAALGGQSDAQPTCAEIWLLGQPSLEDFLDHVRKAAVGGAEMARRPLVDAWRRANDVYARLEEEEDGIADAIGCAPLPDTMLPLAEALAGSDAFRRTFDRVPTGFAMVELDRIVVSQRRVTRTFVEALAARVTPRPDEAGLFRFCQPLERTDPPVRMRRLSGQRVLFTSDSNDLRFHEAALLQPDRIAGHAAFGPIQGVLGLIVGYGSNFLSAIRSGDRVVLHNGYHRAVALRAAGFTHAPCIVQDVTRRDELELTAASSVSGDPAFYFRARRPPLLKDFFDPRLSAVLPTKRAERFVEVSFEVKDYTVYDE